MHRSDALAQREAEPLIRAAVERFLGTGPLLPMPLSLPDGARVDVDGVDVDQTVFVEIYARQGRLKGAQFHKVARDALKLITLTRSRSGVRRILAFADRDAADCVIGRSWLAEALVIWGVEVVVVEIDDAVREGLRAAQARQVMVNLGGG